MGDSVILADNEGNYYRFDATVLESRPPTAGDLAVARIPDTSREAVQTALTYEHAGGFEDADAGREIHVGQQILRMVGRIALG